MNKALVIFFLLSHFLCIASDHNSESEKTAKLSKAEPDKNLSHIRPPMTIENFFRLLTPNVDWPTSVNTILPQENDSLSIQLRTGSGSHYYRNNNTHFPSIIIDKKDVLRLDLEKMLILKHMQRTHCFSRNELSLINDLPDTLSHNLKNYFYHLGYCDGYDNPDDGLDYRIKFHYKKNITMHHIVKTIVTCYKELLPITLVSLLYHHLYIEDMDNLWTKTQNPYLLELNEKKALTNKLIDELQAQSIPGSELLEKKILSNVPFKDTFPEYAKDLYYSNILFGRIISALIINLPAFYSAYYFTPKYYETRGQRKTRSYRFFSSLIFSNLFIFFQPYINTAITKVIFSHGVPQGLAVIVALVTAWGIIKAVIDSYISRLKPRLKIIDFPRNKFKDKSTKQVISYYLNKSTIQIV